MKNILTLILLFSNSPIFLVAQSIQPLWVRTESTDGDLGQGKLPLVLVDAFHDVVVCGSTYAPGPVLGFITTKYDSAGNFLWQRRHDTFATDLITTAVVDGFGAVYVGGNSTNPFTNQTEFIVIKYSADGDVLWQYSYNTLPSAVTYLSALLLDSAQNILIFAHFYDNPSSKSGLLVTKLSPGGNTIWEIIYDEGDFGYSGLDARWVDDHIIFWGQNGSSEGIRFFAWQIALNGQTVNIAHTQPYSDYFRTGYHIDNDGNLYIGDDSGEYKVAKFKMDGTMDWMYKKPVSFSNPNIIPAYLTSITTNSIGETYISGGFRLTDTSGMIGLTSKLNDSGSLVWEHEFSPASIEYVAPYRSRWINADMLLVIGLAVASIDSNFYEYYLAFYNKKGYVKGGITDIEGRRNWPASIAPDGKYFYIAGKADPEFSINEPSSQFLCKYALDEIVATVSPFMSIGAIEPLLLSPNPFSGEIKVSVNHTGETNRGMLEVSDFQGRIMLRKEMLFSPGIHHFTLDVFRGLPAGVYGISITTSKQVYWARAVKAN